jgi:hypothetical protein
VRLQRLAPAGLTVYFDEPVTYSKDHIGTARTAWRSLVPRCDLMLVRSADQELKAAAEDVLVTSDSTLIDATTAPVADLARWVVEDAFGARVPELASFLE